MVNIGCAHGPDFLPFKGDFTLYGVDFSPVMLGLARRYARKFGFEVALALAGADRLPYAGGSFDYALSVAIYHHLRDGKARTQALLELRRVLKPGGEAFITVWNRWQPRFWLKGREVMVPWRAKDITLKRYYYLFSYFELKNLLKRAGFEVLRAPGQEKPWPARFFSRNVCFLVRKAV